MCGPLLGFPAGSTEPAPRDARSTSLHSVLGLAQLQHVRTSLTSPQELGCRPSTAVATALSPEECSACRLPLRAQHGKYCQVRGLGRAGCRKAALLMGFRTAQETDKPLQVPPAGPDPTSWQQVSSVPLQRSHLSPCLLGNVLCLHYYTPLPSHIPGPKPHCWSRGTRPWAWVQ